MRQNSGLGDLQLTNAEMARIVRMDRGRHIFKVSLGEQERTFDPLLRDHGLRSVNPNCKMRALPGMLHGGRKRKSRSSSVLGLLQ